MPQSLLNRGGFDLEHTFLSWSRHIAYNLFAGFEPDTNQISHLMISVLGIERQSLSLLPISPREIPVDLHGLEGGAFDKGNHVPSFEAKALMVRDQDGQCPAAHPLELSKQNSRKMRGVWVDPPRIYNSQ
jgi:hypothetical protein